MNPCKLTPVPVTSSDYCTHMGLRRLAFLDDEALAAELQQAAEVLVAEVLSVTMKC